ncbi:MAG: alpha/beta fold hydrolase [Planctomycetota bacterium]|nr:alpha/beta fold hydrolase [Planctomycetota bacterium]
MSISKALLLTMTLLLFPAGWASPQDGEPDAAVATAYRLIDAMAAGKFDKAVADFDETMRKLMPAEKLEATWKVIAEKVGAFKGRGTARKESIGALEAVFVPCRFEKIPLDAKVVVSLSGEITGLWFNPAQPPVVYTPPDYSNSDSFEEVEVTVGVEGWLLPDTLTVPEGDGPFPAIVLVHGSGPNDRDETIGPNKPLRDMAEGLSSRGIAVLRYEKRTREHALRMLSSGVSLTVKEETIDDARAAVELLARADKVDPKRVFVLGHSLGAMLAPRIANEAVAGLIIMAGPSRPLVELLLDQFEYISGLDGIVTEAERKNIEMVRDAIDQIEKLDPSKDAPEEILGVPPIYWLDLRDYKPAETARGVEVPMLILQGERDYQVKMVDFAGWKKALGERKDVTFKSYPSLNHLFIPGIGKSTPAEYTKSGHVHSEVIDDIARWITGQ